MNEIFNIEVLNKIRQDGKEQWTNIAHLSVLY